METSRQYRVWDMIIKIITPIIIAWLTFVTVSVIKLGELPSPTSIEQTHGQMWIDIGSKASVNNLNNESRQLERRIEERFHEHRKEYHRGEK